MKATDPIIVTERKYHQSLSHVWKAITDVNQMRQWFFKNIPEFEATIGFKTEFPVSVEDRTYTHLWEIVEVIPLQKIKYNWKYKEYQGDSYVTFELSEVNNRTRLKLTAEVVEDFPEGIPEFKRESCQDGWDYFIKQSLKNYLK